MGKIKLGLIGAGWVAEQHLKVIAEIEGIEAAGITSRTRARAEKLASDFNIPVVSNTLDELVKQAIPDALMVLVSEDQMFPVASQALGYKLPLFVEKPAGLLPEENLKLAELARKYSIPAMVGFNRRYYSIFHKGLELIRGAGELSGVFVEGHERMWRVREGKKFSKYVLDNWIFANSTHTIDLLRFFGGETKDLKTIVHSSREPRGDQLAAIMELDNGAIGQYQAHWYSPGGWRVVLYGEGLTVEFKPLEKGRFMGKDFNSIEIEPDPVDVRFKPGFYRQMEAFGGMIRKGKLDWPGLDLFGAYRTMQLAEGITRGN